LTHALLAGIVSFTPRMSQPTSKDYPHLHIYLIMFAMGCQAPVSPQ